MEFKLDYLLATRKRKKSYDFKGILNKNSNSPIKHIELESDSEYDTILSYNANEIVPTQNELHFKEYFDFNNMPSPSDMVDFIIHRETEDPHAGLIKKHTINSISIKDTVYPPPYAGKAAEPLFDEPQVAFSKLFIVERVEICRVDNEKDNPYDDTFDLTITLSYEAEGHYIEGTPEIIDDTYNKFNGDSCCALVLPIIEHTSPNPTSNKQLTFSCKNLNLSLYNSPSLAVVISNKQKNDINWKEIRFKKLALRIK